MENKIIVEQNATKLADDLTISVEAPFIRKYTLREVKQSLVRFNSEIARMTQLRDQQQVLLDTLQLKVDSK